MTIKKYVWGLCCVFIYGYLCSGCNVATGLSPEPDVNVERLVTSLCALRLNHFQLATETVQNRNTILKEELRWFSTESDIFIGKSEKLEKGQKLAKFLEKNQQKLEPIVWDIVKITKEKDETASVVIEILKYVPQFDTKEKKYWLKDETKQFKISMFQLKKHWVVENDKDMQSYIIDVIDGLDPQIITGAD